MNTASYPLCHILDYPELEDEATLDILFEAALSVVRGNEHVRTSLVPERVREWDRGFAENSLASLEAMRLVTLRRIELASQAS